MSDLMFRREVSKEIENIEKLMRKEEEFFTSKDKDEFEKLINFLNRYNYTFYVTAWDDENYRQVVMNNQGEIVDYMQF